MSDPNKGKAQEVVTYAFGYAGALALVQIMVHFRCFLHISVARSARDDLQLILFSTLIVVLRMSGTLVILLNLRHCRM